jgi:hypothetical protein
MDCFEMSDPTVVMIRRCTDESRPLYRRLIGVMVGVGIALCAAAHADGGIQKPVVINVAPEHGTGEVDLLDRDGRTVMRWTGFARPPDLVRLSADRFAMIEPRRLFVVTFDGDFGAPEKIDFSPPIGFERVSATPGKLSFSQEQAGWSSLDLSVEAKAFQRPPPQPGASVTGVAALPDGSEIVAAPKSGSTSPFFYVTSAGSRRVDLPFIQERNINYRPGITVLNAETGEIIIWDVSWGSAYRVAYRQAEFTFLDRIPVVDALELSGSTAGDIVFTSQDFSVTHQRNGREIAKLRLSHPVHGAILSPDGYRYLVSVDRQPDREWPDCLSYGRWPLWGAPPTGPRVRWAWMYGWVGLAVVVGLGINWLALRASARRIVRVEVSRSIADSPAFRPWRALGFAALVVVGVAAGCYGQFLLRADAAKWPWFCAAGIALPAVAYVMNRFTGHRAADRLATSVVYDGRVLAVAIAVLAVLDVLVLHWTITPDNYTNRVGGWLAAIIVIGSLALALRPGAQQSRQRRSWLILAPLSIAVVTLGYRLTDAPVNMVADFTYDALDAVLIIRGQVEDIWRNGFVSVPRVGHVQEVLGIMLAGPGPLGFRLGAVMAGLSGIVAMYLLGSAYRDRTTGLFAALFLAGNIPYIHFNRQPSNGVAGVISLWVLALFLSALKRRDLRLWLLLGFVSAYGFFVWPMPRIALAAVALSGVAIAITHPRLARAQSVGVLVAGVACLSVLIPLMPTWYRDPASLFPRAGDTFIVFKPSRGFNLAFIPESLGGPLLRSFGWFFLFPDHSEGGPPWPGLNVFEASLFATGLATAILGIFAGRFIVNLTIIVYLLLFLLVCGAWAPSPPYYTRLLPTAPIATLLMGATVAALYDSARGLPRRARCLILVFLFVAGALLSPMQNLRTYLRYETMDRAVLEKVAIGRRLQDLGGGYQYYMVITKRPDWSVCSPLEMLPFIWNLRIREVRDLDAGPPPDLSGPTVFIIQAVRFDEDSRTLTRFYPAATVEAIKGRRGETLAGLVIVNDTRPEERPSSPLSWEKQTAQPPRPG